MNVIVVLETTGLIHLRVTCKIGYQVGGVHCYQEIELVLCIKSYSDCMGFDLSMENINVQIKKKSNCFEYCGI